MGGWTIFLDFIVQVENLYQSNNKFKVGNHNMLNLAYRPMEIYVLVYGK